MTKQPALADESNSGFFFVLGQLGCIGALIEIFIEFQESCLSFVDFFQFFP